VVIFSGKSEDSCCSVMDSLKSVSGTQAGQTAGNEQKHKLVF
jgi:hypothetical protein